MKFCIEVLGADRIMWAVDYPYQDHPDAVDFLDAAKISEKDKQKIYHENAERVFKLPKKALRSPVDLQDPTPKKDSSGAFSRRRSRWSCPSCWSDLPSWAGPSDTFWIAGCTRNRG